MQQLLLRAGDQEVSPRVRRGVVGGADSERTWRSGVELWSAVVVIEEEGRVGQLVGVAVVGVGGAFTVRRGRSWASLANMLVELGLERLHELLKILQRSEGLRAIIRCCRAEFA